MNISAIIKIIISFILLIMGHLIDTFNIQITLYVIAYLLVGYEVIFKALRNILKGEVFDENFLMTIATIGAFAIGEYPEAIAVMLFYTIGELFQDYAIDSSKKSIASLMAIRPDYANILKNGKTEKVDPSTIKIDDIIVIKPGEKVPLDGIIIEGETHLNVLALTGEALPLKRGIGDEALSGSINEEKLIKVKVTKIYKDSTVSKILDLVEKATDNKAKSENFITKFARVYTPIIVILALALAIIHPVFMGYEWFPWVYRALSFLVISCPCALVISIPLSFFSGIGYASKEGILIKGSNYLEALNNASVIVCDKTGTLTEGVFEVTKINAKGSKKELLYNAAMAESYSNHPISISLRNAYDGEVDLKKVKSTEEISGMGIKALIGKDTILVGNATLMEKYHIKYEVLDEVGTIIYVAKNDEFLGSILISDKIKKDAKETIEYLKKLKKEVIMLTGDKLEISKRVASSLGISKYYAELLPQDKVYKMEELLNDKDGNIIFVGDGINDAPVLALADVGISMGGLGSDAAIEASDVVIMTDEVSKIGEIIEIAHDTMRIVRENIFISIAIKVIILILSALGLVTMWAAVFADVGVTVLATLNALRLLRMKRKAR